MSKSPVFLRHRLLESVQVKERFHFCLFTENLLEKKKKQVGKENPLFRYRKNTPFGSEKTALSFAVPLKLLAHKS